MRAGHWLAFVGAVLVIVGLAGFGFYRIRHGAPAPTTTPKLVASAEVDPFSSLRQLLKGVQLPQAAHGRAHHGQANLIVTREAIYLDNERLADLALANNQGKVQRVDPVFYMLKARREQWKAAHPGEPFRGQVALWVDERVGLVEVKSIFQTAAFAGYPNAGFVARCSCPQDVTVVPADARPPGPPPEPPEPPEPRPRLAVLVRSVDQVELVWSSEDIPAAPRTVKPSELPAALEELWAQGNAARGAASEPPQQAVVYVDDAQTLGSLVKVLEALQRPRYTTSANGERQEYPSFNPTLTISKVPEDTLELAKMLRHGVRLVPNMIHAVVRQHFPDYRRCYDRLLAKDPKARGRVPMVFTISRTGEVSAASVAEGRSLSELLPDEERAEPKAPRLSNPQLERCLISAFKQLKFPPPEGGIMNVGYPLSFAPD